MAERCDVPAAGALRVVGSSESVDEPVSSSSRARPGIPLLGRAAEGSGIPARGRNDDGAEPASTVRTVARRTVRKAKRQRARKPVRWSAKRETAFLEALAESSNVALSLRASGLLATCRDRFANAANFRGEPWLPGNDLLTRYPGT